MNALPASVTLKQIKDSGLFPDWDLVRLPRLSVMPVSIEQWEKGDELDISINQLQ
ncbi:MAG: EVE domain-containing protein [Bacillota bacterium]